MRTNTPRTPLLQILRNMTPAQRDEFALISGTTVSYLYQLAGCHRLSCRAGLTKAIADASVLMSAKYGTGVITMDALATMCYLPVVEPVGA